MFRAIGILIVLWGLSHFFNNAFTALDGAAAETFRALEAAAVVSQTQLQDAL